MSKFRAKNNDPRTIRHNRVRAKVVGTTERPRLSVFRSSKFIYAQLIDDSVGKTLAAASSKEVKGGAAKVGVAIAKAAKEHKVKKAVFDRGGYRYLGQIKALADGAREGGLQF